MFEFLSGNGRWAQQGFFLFAGSTCLYAFYSTIGNLQSPHDVPSALPWFLLATTFIYFLWFMRRYLQIVKGHDVETEGFDIVISGFIWGTGMACITNVLSPAIWFRYMGSLSVLAGIKDMQLAYKPSATAEYKERHMQGMRHEIFFGASLLIISIQPSNTTLAIGALYTCAWVLVWLIDHVRKYKQGSPEGFASRILLKGGFMIPTISHGDCPRPAQGTLIFTKNMTLESFRSFLTNGVSISNDENVLPGETAIANVQAVYQAIGRSAPAPFCSLAARTNLVHQSEVSSYGCITLVLDSTRVVPDATIFNGDVKNLGYSGQQSGYNMSHIEAHPATTPTPALVIALDSLAKARGAGNKRLRDGYFEARLERPLMPIDVIQIFVPYRDMVADITSLVQLNATKFT